MRIALVTSSYLPRPGELERHVHALARGLAHRGAQVEVLTQDGTRELPPVSEFDGFVVRRFASNAHFAVAPGLWEHLRHLAGSFDVVDVHTTHMPLALAVARAHPRRLIFTPYVVARRLLRWPNVRMTRLLVEQAARTVCASLAEGELLSRNWPWAGSRVEVVPPTVDEAGIRMARPFAFPGSVVLAVGRLERHKGIDRVIAALAGLDSGFRLAVVGGGSYRHRLLAHAVDLQVSSRLELVGAVPDAELHRWLRTARVTVALADRDRSGLQVMEALAAGTPVVASNIPVHWEAASHADGEGVKFLPPASSPLAVADAIREAAELDVPRAAPSRAPGPDELVERMLAIYGRALDGRPSVTGAPEAA